MAASFPGLSKQALRFFRELAENNNRDWFEAHKGVYLEHLKAPMEALVEAVGAEMVKFAPNEVTMPQKAIYRIYRDTRFSADKTPYKTHLGASFFRHDLGKHIAGGYYFEVSHKYVGIAGGVYMPTPENLRLLRGHIADNGARFKKIVGAKRLVEKLGPLQGERLVRPPKGFDPDHAAIDWIKYKQWYYWKELPAELAATPKLLGELVECFKLMQPTIEFFNEPLLADKKRRAPMETGWV